MMPYPAGNVDENTKKELCASRKTLLCFAENATKQGSEGHDSCFICLRANIISEATTTDETQKVTCYSIFPCINCYSYIYIFYIDSK